MSSISCILSDYSILTDHILTSYPDFSKVTLNMAYFYSQKKIVHDYLATTHH